MSLYERLGQSEAITAVVAKFYEIMLQDQRVAHYFAQTDMEKQRARQVAFITLVTGGPNLYEGADMKAAHCKHAIGHMEFDATWENLEQALHFFNVPAQQVSELKEIFYSVESQIVNKVEKVEPSQKEVKTLKEVKTQKSVKGKCPFHQQQSASEVSEKDCSVAQKATDEHCEQKKEPQALYEKLGGHGAVSLVVNKFYEFMLQDDRVKAYFANTDMEKQKLSQIEFISMVTGGPCNYSGKDMKAAHCPYKIGHLQFDATWENLEKAFECFKVDSGLVKEVKEIFYSVQGEIVNSTGEQAPKQEVVEEASTQKPGAQECPHKLETSREYSQAELMKCPHMAMKLKEVDANCYKLSQCEKRKLRQEVLLKEEANKEAKKLSNNPYHKIYY